MALNKMALFDIDIDIELPSSFTNSRDKNAPFRTAAANAIYKISCLIRGRGSHSNVR